MNNTAIIIGATGLIGRALTDQLAEHPSIQEIITLTRRPITHTSSKVHNHVIDFDALQNYASLFKGNWLFSCLGTTRKQAGSIAAQRRIDLDYQYHAAQLAAENGIPHYLLISSPAANPKSKSPYLKMKGELEQKIQALPFKRISIFQPSLLIGTRDHLRIGERLASIIMPAACRLPGLGRYRPIKDEQLAAKMIQVSQQKGETLETFALEQTFCD